MFTQFLASDRAFRTLLIVAAAFLVSMASVPSAYADNTDPAKIVDDAVLRQEITTQVRTIAAATDESARLKQQLTQALAAYREQQEKRKPVAERLAVPVQKIAEIDGFNYLHALPPQLEKQIKNLTEYRQYLIVELQRGRVPSGFTWETYRLHAIDMDAYLRRLVRVQAILKERLPTLRQPAFVPAGVSLADHRATLDAEKLRIEAELRPVEEELQARETRLRGLMGREAHQERIAKDATSRYYQLLFAAQRRFRPPHLAEVKLYAALDPRRPAERLHYHAIVEEPAELVLLDAKIDQLVEHLPTLQSQANDAYRLFQDAERKFVATSDRWQAKNDEYGWIIYKEHALNGVLEVVDAAIGIAADGGTPAAFLFEGAFRTFEGVQWLVGSGENKFRLAEPRLSDELLAYRQRVSERLTPNAGNEAPLLPGGADGLIAQAEQQLRQRRLFESLAATADQHINDQADEAIKGALATAFGPALEALAESCAKEGKKLTRRQVVGAIFLSALTPELTREKLLELLPNRNFNPQIPALEEFLSKAATSRTDLLLRNLKDLNTYKDVAKGFVISAIVTAEKQALKDSVGYAEDRGKLMAEMALLDIEWFGRRAEYTAAGHFHRQVLQMQADHRALIGSLFAERAKIQERKLKVLVNQPLATLDAIDGELRFSGGVHRVEARIGQNNFTAEIGRDGVARFNTRGRDLPVGEQTIGVSVRPAPGGNHAPFDANPLTVVRYVGPSPTDKPDAARTDELWAGADQGADTLHRIKVEAPSMAVVADGGKPFVCGDWVTVDYKLPGSLSYRGIRLTAMPMETPVEINAPSGVAAGQMQFQLPMPPKAYQLMLIGGPRNDPTKSVLIASAPVTAAAVVAREIARGPFSRATQFDLPTRGQRATASDRPIAEGSGRLTFESRDAANQWISMHYTVTVAGEKKAMWSGWNTHLDVPPGNYTISANYNPDIVVENVQVVAGQPTPVRFGGYGRLRFACRDGVGTAFQPHVTVYPQDGKNAIWSGWHPVKDLPAGNYRVVFDWVVDIEQKDVLVTAGMETLIEGGGYARFTMPAVDGLNQKHNPHRTIYPAGSDKAVWGGWSESVDLPPGDYTISFSYVEDIRFEGQRLTAGQVTTVRAGGFGRLSMPALNAQGKAVSLHRTIYRVGADKATWGGWANTIDLPPGNWELRWNVGGKELKAVVAVVAGQSAATEIRVP